MPDLDFNNGLYTFGEDGKLVYNNSLFKDLTFSFTRGRLGSLSKPDFDYTNVGLLFPQNDATEILYMIGQFNHDRKSGSDIYPHVHWRQSAVTAVTWKLAYKWFNNGSSVPSSFTIISTSTGKFSYSSGNLAQISEFPTITGSSITGLSSIILMKFYREDNPTIGDVLGFEFDLHYELDSAGSSAEYTK